MSTRPRKQQTLNQQLSARVNWLVFQLDGALTNITHWFKYLIRDPQRFEYRDEDLYKLYSLEKRAAAACEELRAVRKEVAEWNKSKKRAES